MEDLKEMEPKERAVKSSLGRSRLFDGKFGLPERKSAKATLLQQEEADLLRMAVMSLYVTFRDMAMKSRVVLVVHDAVYVEAPEDQAQRARHLVKVIMEDAVEMPVVPLAADIE